MEGSSRGWWTLTVMEQQRDLRDLLEVVGSLETAGKLVRGFSANFGVCSSFRAEIKAVTHGLELAKSLGIRQLIVQMDNLACIQMLTHDDYGGGECHHLLNHCRLMIKETP
ncbi:Phosphoenolpyruvate carboxylase [Bienertia sinuspersici]